MKVRYCPKCLVPLKQETVRNIVIDRCSTCNGAWYDWKEIESLLESKRALLHYVAPENRRIYKGNVLCPVCTDPMNVLRQNSVFAFDIDICVNEHGIWLDATEFEKLREVVEKSRYRLKTLPAESKEEDQKLQKDLAHIENRLDTHLQREKYYQTPVTWILLGIQTLVFCWLFFQGRLASAIANYGFIPEKMTHDPATAAGSLLSALFLHGDPLHVAGNGLFLLLLGREIEIQMKQGPYLVLYLVSGAAALLTGLLGSKASLSLSHIGDGGAISALLGMYLLLSFKNGCPLLVRKLFSGGVFRIPCPVYLSVWIGLQGFCAFSGIQGSDYRVHLAGFLTGILFGVGWRIFSRKS